MGPRLGSRGKQWKVSAYTGKNRLQWGRDLEVAESGYRTALPESRWSLQWGRDLEVAEKKSSGRKL